MGTSASLAPAELARARHHSYLLVSRLFLDGLTTDLIPTLRQIAALAAFLPSTFDVDEAAATHYELFGLNIFPYEAVFLEVGARGSAIQLGGPATQRVEQHLQEANYPLPSGDVSADHVGHELGLLAHLSAAEAGAWKEGRDEKARRIQLRQRDFLQAHLLRWLPSLVQAIKEHGQPFYTALSDLALELVQDHALALPLSETVASFLQNNPPPSLQDEKTGLRQIARYLSTPSHSGIYLSRKAIGARARDLGLPHGFGGREQMLENLFRAAVQYDSLRPLLGALDNVVLRWQDAYQQVFVDDLHRFVQPWLARVAATHALLHEMEAMSEDYDE